MKIVAVTFIVLTTLDGFEVSINTEQIVRLTESREASDNPRPNTMVTPGARCVISLADGKFLSVREECDDIRAKIEEMK